MGAGKGGKEVEREASRLIWHYSNPQGIWKAMAVMNRGLSAAMGQLSARFITYLYCKGGATRLQNGTFTPPKHGITRQLMVKSTSIQSSKSTSIFTVSECKHHPEL
jgi:hypothetical protein